MLDQIAVMIVVAMAHPLSTAPALLFGAFLRKSWLHVILFTWGGVMVAIAIRLADVQHVSTGPLSLAAVLLAPVLAGYAAAGMAWLVRRIWRARRPQPTS